MNMVSHETKQIDWFLTHGVEAILPSREALREKLLSGARLRIYHGIDPTGPTLHLGHTIPLRKLAELQALGHEIILLIGDFTAMIGDPTDKTATRKKQTREEVLANCALYKEQASKFLSFAGPNAASFRFNSEWLAKMSFADVVELASHFTVQQMLERDMFSKRDSYAYVCSNCGTEQTWSSLRFNPDFGVRTSDAGKELTANRICKKCKHETSFDEVKSRLISPRPIYLHEFFYPLMQGQDSVALDVDLEIGGNDQLFNMLAGRTLLREVKQKEKLVLTVKLLTDPTGKKMGKSEGNMIAMTDAPEDMYGEVMNWSDEMILPGFEICTDKTEEELEEVRDALKGGENPMQWKRYLAHRIVADLVSEDAANAAADHFSKVHQEHEKPEEIAEVHVSSASLSLIDALVEGGLVPSKSEARRQIEQGGIRVDDQPVTDVKAMIDIGKNGVVIQKGKRHFIKLIV